jgi:hypothetical protein
MAMDFVRASSQGLDCGFAPVSAYDFTMACWFSPDDMTNAQVLMQIAYSLDGAKYINLEYRPDGYGQIRIIVRQTNYKYADTVNTPTQGQWHHACAVCKQSYRAVYLDADIANKGVNTDSKNFPAFLDESAIARRNNAGSPDMHFDGRICESAYWNCELTEDEMAILAKGYSPLFVRPQNLVRYNPILDYHTGLNRVYGRTSSVWYAMVNSPALSPHPKVLYPSGRLMPGPMAAVGMTPLLLRAIEKY